METSEIKGFLNINKPKGITSFDVIRKIKKIFYEGGQKPPKIGHTGTLDPFATGVLVICLGREYTRRASEVQAMKKEYIVDIKLGAVSDSYDSTGEIRQKVKGKSQKSISVDQVKGLLQKFIGEIEQTPPIFSAKKINGERAYKLARAGKEVKMRKSRVSIYDIQVLDYKYSDLKLKVQCSKGTYIRSLANDIGQALGVGAYADELKRTAVGDFSIQKSTELADLTLEKLSENLIS
jgi:tRNA pseudouridine55 synthase